MTPCRMFHFLGNKTLVRLSGRGIGDIRRFISEGLAGRKSHLLIRVARPADDVVPAVVPADAGLAVCDRPGTVFRAEGFCRLAIAFESNQEGSSRAIAHFPFRSEERRVGKECRL